VNIAEVAWRGGGALIEKMFAETPLIPRELPWLIAEEIARRSSK